MVIWSFFSLVLTPSGFPAWCWLQAKPRYRLPGHMPTPKLYPLFFHYFNFVLVVLRQFWYQSKHRSIWSEASRSQSKTRKNHHKKKKKKIPLHRVFSTRELSLSFFLLGPRKFPFSCVSQYQKKKRDPRKTHHSQAAKTHKINTHRHGTQQPPAASHCKAQHLTSLTSRQNPKPQHLTLDHHRCQSPRRAAATPPCLMPPLSPRLHAATRRRSPTPAKDLHRRDCLYLQFNFFWVLLVSFEILFS